MNLANKNIKQLRDLRAEAIEQMQAVSDLGRKEKRLLTPEEEEQWDRSERDVKLIDAKLPVLAEEEQRNSRNAAKYGSVLAGTGLSQNELEESEWVDTRSGLPVEVLQRGQRFTDSLAPADRNLSLGKAVRSLITNDWKGAEAEQRALSTSVGSAGVTVPHILMAGVMDKARSKSVLMQAGVQSVNMTSNNLTIAKVNSDPAFQWKAENEPFADSAVGFVGVELNAHTFGTVIPLSRELAADAGNIVQVIEDAMAKSLAEELDRIGLYGDGVDKPLGIFNQPGIGEIAAVGQITDYGQLVQAWVEILENSGDPNAYILSPREVGTYAQLVAGADGQYLKAPADIERLQRLFSSKMVPSGALMGDFTKALWGVRQGALLEITTTGSESFRNHQVLIKITWRGDLVLTEPSHFVKMTGITAV